MLIKANSTLFTMLDVLSYLKCANAAVTSRSPPTSYFHFEFITAFYMSGSRFQTMLPQNERDSFPYLLVLVSGSLRRSFILKLYGSIFRLKNSHRKEGLPEVIHLHTSNISFCKFFTCILTSSFLCNSSSKVESKSFKLHAKA